MAGTEFGQGLIARVTTALRYAVTGNAPGDWFGPGTPLAPQAPEDVRGRSFDYPTVFNLNYKPRGGEPLGFEGLKRLAKHPIVAMLIQRQIDKVTAVGWQIKPRLGELPTKGEDPEIATITNFFRMPDQQHDWGQWIGSVLDQLLVIDAVSIYGAPTRSGGLYALQALDGATIKPLLDLGGRSPMAPNAAYQQVLKGLPAIDYTLDELVYFPQRYRADRVYGYSRVEQAADLIEAAISRLRSQRGYFDFGNIGDGFFTMPIDWNVDNQMILETKWNAMMQGDPALRRQVPFLPNGVEWHETKKDVLSDAFDEFLIRLLCFPFGVAPTPFMKQTGLGKGSAGTEHEAAEEGGVAPLMQFVERLVSLMIGKFWKRPDLEFTFVDEREFDPKVAAEIQDTKLRNGSITLDEARDADGKPPYPSGGDKPLIYTKSGAVLLEDAIKPPEPVPAALAAPGTGPEDAIDPADGTTKTDPLAKAADAAATKRLSLIIASYLSAKAQAVAATIADALVKSSPSSEDYSGRVDSAFESADWDWSDLTPLVEPVIAGVAVAAGHEAVSSLGLFDPATLQLVTARAVEYAQARSAELVGMRVVDGEVVPNPDAEWSISETTRDSLRGLVTKAMQDGASNDELRSAITDATTFNADRADTIARTETAYADIRGAAAGWIESGVVAGAQFDASPDCCEDCQADDGTVVPLASPDDLDLPHPACRCSWSAVLNEDMPDAADAPDDDTED
jgi:hypothetical protein